MARLRREVVDESDEERISPRTRKPPELTRAAIPSRAKPKAKATERQAEPDESSAEDSDAVSEAKSRSSEKSAPKSRPQIRLAPLKALPQQTTLTIQEDLPKRSRKKTPLGPTISREQKPESKKNPTRRATPEPEIPSSIPSDEEVENLYQRDASAKGGPHAEDSDFEESIWCGSDGHSDDDDLPSPSTFFPARRKGRDQPDVSRQMKALQIFDDEVIAPPRLSNPNNGRELLRPTSSSDKENNNATIRLSPPRPRNLSGKSSFERPTTPPPAAESPGKLRSPSKLQSPSKRIPRVPTPPLRPSLDAFWTAEAVNDWNDQYSPQKPLKSPRKLFPARSTAFDEDDSVPKVSPCKLLQSPSKRTKAEIQARKDWDIRKHDLAYKFLTELDQTITGGRVSELSQSTGGIKLIWSKTLNSTAGRANWRRETSRTHSKDDPKKVITTHKHFASIELAEKVLTYSEEAETKLINVIAHEFCHLCNFMISGIKDQPHGASFKQWGAKCSRAFADRGITVTTKHSYEIEYKYIWQCEDEDCGMEFKRHSKSIDPKRHRCGQCKANLLQIKPVPRGGTKSSGKATPVGGYAAYVKEHFASLKKGMPGASHKEVMEALGKQYRAEKAAKAAVDIDDVAKRLGDVRLE